MSKQETTLENLSKEDGSSPDLVQENIERLKECFPEVFTEGKIDFGALKQTLGDYTDEREERYSFTWHGKSQARRVAQQPSSGTMRPYPKESVNWDTTKNIFIEGDNLEVLKLLQKGYHRKVKMVYINSPYNIEKEVIFPAGQPEGLSTYLRYAGLEDVGQVKFPANTSGSGRHHTNWLNVMYPRLRLARNLISDDGYLVASIDDTELKHLLFLLDELFGEENRLAVLVLDRNRKNDAHFFSVGHEYLVVYAKRKATLVSMGTRLREAKPGVEELRKLFSALQDEHGNDWTRVKKGIAEHFASFESDDPRRPLMRFTQVDANGPYRTDGDISWPGGGGPRYEVIHPKTGRACKVPSRGWVWPSVERMNEEIHNGRVEFGKDENTVPSRRRNLFDSSEQVMRSVGFSYAQTTSQNLAKLFDGVKVLGNSKDPGDLMRLINYLTESNDTVLELFGGGASTAHAVYMSNAQFGAQRRFICVQIPEPLRDAKTGKAAEEFCTSHDLDPNLASIARERIRRASRSVDQTKLLDAGFRSFHLDSSNIRPWRARFDDMEESLLAAVESIDSSRSQADILFELLIKFGLDLSTQIEERTISGQSVFVIGAGALIVCLDSSVTVELAQGIATMKEKLSPAVMRVVLRDSSFKNDVVKANIVQILIQAGVDGVRSL